MPDDLPRTTFHGFAGPDPVFGPRTISAIVIARAPMRFVNQVESGTSPSVFTFTAGGMGPFGRCLNVCSITS